jgi:tyrosinase
VYATGVYHQFVERHQRAMMSLTLLPGETTATTQRNVAHRGPAFLPWHRQALVDLEREMQRVVPGVQIPYWPWDRDGSRWRNSSFITLMGGNGSSSRGYRITKGPFRDWNSRLYDAVTNSFYTRSGIVRQFSSTAMPGGPSLSIPFSDVAPWSERSDATQSFRKSLEDRHNWVHDIVGGDMGVGTAPNDPIFWCHHANTDRLWAEWQRADAAHGYQPVTGGPTGHNLDDVMGFLVATNVTPRSVLTPPAYG